jgi:glycosyltransferase involved in cell wall biosynthesis
MAGNMALERTDIDDILVIIPVLDEEDTIVQVIDALHQQGLMHIRVVDNGSSDRSKIKALGVGAEVIDEPKSGYGQACWQGLQSIPSEIEWILFCDGDGSDDFSTLPQWFEQCDHYDFILGDRTATAAGRAVLSPVQQFGNHLATTFIRWGWGYRYRDLGPLRFIRRSALAQIQMQDRGFGWTLEMQVRAVELGLRIWECPVGYAPRQGGRSKISGTLRGSVQAGTIILSTLVRLCCRRLFHQWGLTQ